MEGGDFLRFYLQRDISVTTSRVIAAECASMYIILHIKVRKSC